MSKPSPKRRLRRVALISVLLVSVGVGGFFLARHLMRMGAGADVKAFTPHDADVILWVPRLDEAGEAFFGFTRGIQEASRLRQLLEAETGVDLGNADGLRAVGLDPEAGLVIFARGGLWHLLFGVEDPETFGTALGAKFRNLGYSAPETRRLAESVQATSVSDEAGNLYATWAASEGLMVVVYRGTPEDADTALADVFAQKVGSFFEAPVFANVQKRVGEGGPLVYLSGAAMAARAKDQLSMLDALGLPGVVDAMIRPKITTYLSGLEFAAARIDVSSCATAIDAVLSVDGELTLIPDSWHVKAEQPAPHLGEVLPRDSVFMLRLGFDASQATELVKSLTSGLANMGNLLGMGGEKFDPLAGVLSGQIHPDLSDRHILTDVVAHLTGHVGVALVGLESKAKLSRVLRPKSAVEWLSKVELVATVQLKDPKAFWNTWWPKRDVLGKLGFFMEQLEHEQWQALRLVRNCKAPPPGYRGPIPPCEQYGVILKDDLLVLTTGKDTLERVFQTMTGDAADLGGLTREATAIAVLEDSPITLGGYFSFDGLLKAIANRNLPGGATRYLAQMYEFAFTFDTGGPDNPGGVRSQILLTR